MKYYLTVLTSLLILSCSSDKKRDRATPVPNKIRKSLKESGTNKIGHLLTPAITALPFGIDQNSRKLNSSDKFYTDLVYKNMEKLMSEGWTEKNLQAVNIYKLPFIKKINYFGVSYVDTGKCGDGQPFGKFIQLSKYRYRLPDINGLQCYYWCNFNNNSTTEYPRSVADNCGASIISFLYGYLIFYNPHTQEANVICNYFYTYIDGMDHMRHFYIDKNYNIWLTDFATPADDVETDGGPPDLESEHLLTISNKGEINIKKIK